MFNVGYCDLCQKPAKQRCGGCHEIFYCSKEHQKSGWKGHKIVCRPCKVAEDDTLGRFLVSTKSIKKGEIVIKEHPLIYGPSQITIPICLGCGKPIDGRNNHPCPKCGWPMCSEICQKNPSHLPECRYTVQRGDKVSIRNFGIIHPFYQCVTVLRCLYQKQYLPDVWKKLDKLESHCEDRKNTPKFKNERVQVAQFIRKFFKLDQIFTEDDIMRVCGIILVNSHEVPLAEPPFIAIYEMCSMFEHRCKANCSKSFTKDGGILLVAGEDIQKGDHLSICYTDPLWGTLNRRQHLYETKFFWCTCSRCSDVTEFGTYFSALNCQEENCDGNLLPKTFLQKMDNTKDSNWHCNKCDKNISYFSVHDLLEKLGSDLAELPKNDVNNIKQFLSSSSIYLHQNHFYLTEIRLALVQLIGQGNNSESMTEISEEDLELKAKIATQLLSLFDSIAPAERRLKGIVLFELHASLAEMGRRNGEPDTMHRRLTEARRYLIDCIDTLKDEPIFLPEGQILRQAKQNLKSIDIVLQKILESVTSPT